MQSERRSRRSLSRPPLVTGPDQAPVDVALKGLADYDQAIAEIDGIIAQLEDGQHSLDEEMRLYEHAMHLAHACDQLLQNAELRVEQLRADLSTEASSMTLGDFDTEDE